MAEQVEKKKVRKSRASNMTASEKVILAELVTKYGSIIENKKTDAMSTKEKEVGWQSLAMEFQAYGGQRRQWKQLKNVRIASQS